MYVGFQFQGSDMIAFKFLVMRNLCTWLMLYVIICNFHKTFNFIIVKIKKYATQSIVVWMSAHGGSYRA